MDFVNNAFRLAYCPISLYIDILLDLIDFEHHLEDADLVITGEGRIDSQSLHGKVISGISKRTRAA